MRALLDVVFPRTCSTCGARSEVPLCEPCFETFPWIERCCARCGLPGPSMCNGCRAKRPPFVSARAPARYEGVARDLLMRFKLGGERRAAPAMAALMAAVSDAPAGIVTAVPSTRAAIASRGFDPAKALANGVCSLLALPHVDLLAKVRKTHDSVGLGRADRRANLAGAFRARRCDGSVLLVDDVMTTGATAEVCARALLDAGAGRVHVLTFARTV